MNTTVVIKDSRVPVSTELLNNSQDEVSKVVKEFWPEVKVNLIEEITLHQKPKSPKRPIKIPNELKIIQNQNHISSFISNSTFENKKSPSAPYLNQSSQNQQKLAQKAIKTLTQNFL